MNQLPPLRVGIVGLGFMASTHIKAFRHLTSDIQLAALCNPSGRHLDGDFSQVSGNIGAQDPLKLDMTNVQTYRDFNAMLEDPNVDVIDICAPTWTHPDLAIAALQSGKHVICEKPLARTASAAKRIVEASRTARGMFMPAMCIRFWPEWAWLKSAIADGRYGRVLAARFRRVAEPPAWGHQHFGEGAKSGGGLLDLHIHDTDFVQYCFGPPMAVFSQGYTKFSGAIDHVTTQYVVQNGAAVHAEGSWAMAKGFGFNMGFTVNFENATADYDIARGADALKVSENGQTQIIKPSGIDGYVSEFSHLVSSIRSGQPPSVVTPEDGWRAVHICEAEERSVISKAIETINYSDLQP